MSSRLKQLDYSILQQCMHCGMCLPVCPTFEATKRERHGPRGRIALMRAVADGDLEAGPEFAKEMSFCLGCLACQSACPAGVDYARLFETARAEVEASAVPSSTSRRFWRTLALRFLFMRPRWLRALGRGLQIYQRMGLQSLVRGSGLVRLLPATLQRLEPQTPRIASRFSDRLIAPLETPENTPRHRVLMLTGCVQDLAFSDVNRDTVDVLLANRCEVITPPVQACCGSLHAHNGELGLAADLARRWLDQIDLQSIDAIITNAGGCGAHLRHYAVLLADDPAYSEQAKQWDAKVRDIHEWLLESGCRAPTCGIKEEPTVVTYHDSCHLAHGQKVTRQPRELLRLIPGLVLKDLPESDWCCGSAGVYSITQPDFSARLLERKVSHVISTGAQILATSNPGCHLQIAHGLRIAGSEIEIIQPVSLLARAYRTEIGQNQPSGGPRCS
jgi:glycolate oxidase iron-sulfur subunit